MSELLGKNSVLRASRALSHFLGSFALPTTEFAAVQGEEDDGFKIPEPTYTTRPLGTRRLNHNPAGPTQAEIDDRPLIYAALEARDDWDSEPRPMYLPDSSSPRQ